MSEVKHTEQKTVETTNESTPGSKPPEVFRQDLKDVADPSKPLTPATETTQTTETTVKTDK